MIIYVDENVPLKIATRLREEGYQVEHVSRSVEDREILEIARKQKALLITSDKDFERLILNERRPTAGVILLRIATRIPMEHRAQIVVNMLRKHQDKLEGTLTILSEIAMDIRRPIRKIQESIPAYNDQSTPDQVTAPYLWGP
jgi:predicted nuclease of predicted toxin-antitoxin system